MSASSCYDSLRMTESVKPETPDFTAKDRQFLDIYDNNNGSYTGGQITFDGQSLVNSHRYLDLKSSYLTIPITATLTVAGNTIAGAAGAANAFAVSLKNGTFQLINGMTVNLANQSVINLQSFSNIPIAYKILSTWTDADQETLGPSMNFWKDNGSSTKWDAVQGEQNSSIEIDATPTLADPYPINNGRQMRLLRNWAVPTSDALGNPSLAPGIMSVACDNSTLTNAQRSTVLVTTGTPLTLVFQINAQIHMRFLHDLFDKMPLHRGALWQFTFHTHLPTSFEQTFTGSAAAQHPFKTNVVASVNNTPNGFSPFMISRPGPASGVSGLAITTASGDYTVNLTTKVGNQQNSTCVLHCAMIELENNVACTYIANPRRRVVYTDFIRNPPSALQNVPPNGTARANITAGIAKPRGLLIFPHLAIGANGVNNVGAGSVSALSSPWSSCGATTAHGAFLNNFNVQVNGANIYEKNIRYRYDHFLREQFGVLSPSGNGVDGMRVGLLDEHDFNTGYGFVYVNLERHPKANDNVPAAIDIELVNASKQAVSYMCFILFEREFEIDSYTGKLVI